MSSIQSLKVHHFRNLIATTLNCSPRFNLFYGANGAGKTSLLEAIYCLGLGKSFRANQSNVIIEHNQQEFSVFAKLEQATLGIQRDRQGKRQIKLNSDLQTSIAPITKRLPIQFMSPMSYRFFHDGPKGRRQFLDWALFHVEPTFLNVWQQLQRSLKQRNSALKSQQNTLAWDNTFIQSAEAIDKLRNQAFDAIEPLCLQQLQCLLPDFTFKLHYQRGWAQAESLSTLLDKNRYRDQQLGYTYYGPQRADLRLSCEKTAVQDVLSQGQQKLAAYALHLSLGTYLQQQTATSPIYLIDDLPSELDRNSNEKISQALQKLNAQAFISGICSKDLSSLSQLKQSQLFHVEHGKISEGNPEKIA